MHKMCNFKNKIQLFFFACLIYQHNSRLYRNYRLADKIKEIRHDGSFATFSHLLFKYRVIHSLIVLITHLCHNKCSIRGPPHYAPLLRCDVSLRTTFQYVNVRLRYAVCTVQAGPARFQCNSSTKNSKNSLHVRILYLKFNWYLMLRR